MIAARLANLQRGTNRYGAKVDASKEASTFSREQAAAAATALGVSTKSVERARAVAQHGTDEERELVELGRASLNSDLASVAPM